MTNTPGTGSFPQVTWENDDSDFDDLTGEPKEDSSDFAALLGKDDGAALKRPRITVGEPATGKVLSISPTTDDVLIDLGGKLSGVISKKEFTDEAGVISIKTGDAITAHVISRQGDEVTLSTKLTFALRSVADLERAQQAGAPVKGKVTGVNKGGFEVLVLGKEAFCPISQMDTKFVQDTAQYLNKDLEFMITRVDGGGRNIVLSRAALLRAQGEQRVKELQASLKPDTILQGKVTEVRDYGAFVDIGGVDGMVHVSELSHARVTHPRDVVSVGDSVMVKVLKVETEGGRAKISLSMKAAGQDPWDNIEAAVRVGESYTGRVTNVMAFGAFVEVKPGIEGLVHVSEMSWTKRIHHPSEVVKAGDMVSITVKTIDRGAKRISLSMKQVEDDPWFESAAKFPVGKEIEGKVERLKNFGAIVELAPGVTGMLPMGAIKRRFGEAYRQAVSPGKMVGVRIQTVDAVERKLLLTLPGLDDEDGDADYREYLKSEAKAAEPVAQAPASDKVGSFGALLGAKLNKK